MRLAIQKLCVQLGKPGKNLNEDIGSLVSDGLPIQIQQSLDIVRVTGNESVHPGELDVRDDLENVADLFTLVNTIAYQQLTLPRQTQEMYDALPTSKLEQIEKRDGD